VIRSRVLTILLVLMNGSPATRREAALGLAEQLLGEIELGSVSPSDVVLRGSRLARLRDDTDAMAWLQYEIGGYPEAALPPEAFAAARRSNRVFRGEDGTERAWTATVGEIGAKIDAATTQLSVSGDTPISVSTESFPIMKQAAEAVQASRVERAGLRGQIANNRGLLGKVLGAIHSYVADRYQELRFGAAVEGAFEVVRSNVDANLAGLVPDALPRLSAAFENTTSTNPEDWASAAATCRRLLKAAADALRPPGEPVDGREMTDSHYINRLVDWIINQAESDTAADLMRSDLEYLGRRLDAVNDAGHKGAHADVSQLDASRFVVGTYLLLGDILRLADSDATGEQDGL
jgi:hypothetical protein